MTAPSPLADVLDRDDLPGDLDVAEIEHSLQRHVLHEPGVRILTLVRFCTSLGLSTLAYGVMVYLAVTGSAQAVISLVGVIRFLTALLFGLGGGALAEIMTTRPALIVTYVLQAAACFIVPTFLGVNLGSLLFLVFIETTLGQLGTPALKAATAEVTTTAQVAVAAAILSVAGGIGAAVGSAFVAPILINVATMTAVIYVAGVALALSAVRIWRLPANAAAPSPLQAIRTVEWRAMAPSPQRTAMWVLENRRFAAMILVGGMAAALYEGMNSLLPVFVRDVLGANPTNTVFIIAPGGLGFLVGAAVGPWLMDHRGERALLIYSLAILSLGFVLFTFIEQVAPVLSPFSPLGLLDVFGFELSPQMKAAGLISILTMFGSTAASAAVQTYVNRYVMLARQAKTFGMQELLDNLLVLVTLVALGGIATAVGPRLVFLFAPPLLVVFVVSLIWASFHVTANEPPEVQAILRSIFNPAPWDSPARQRPAGRG